MSSTWGDRIRLSIFGGSHTKAIGVTIDGLPAGEKIDLEEVYLQMSRRAPGQDPAATARKEADCPQILCGMNEDSVLTGAPLTAVIENGNQRSKDYSELKAKPRPGHADYTAYVKYSGYNDIRGGGHFSGRLTAPLVFAGAVCRQILSRLGVEIGAHAESIGSVKDEKLNPAQVTKDKLRELSRVYFPVIDTEVKTRMYEEIEKARMNRDSVGGIIECAAAGLPAGLGDPMFGGVENKISSIIFGIPAVKGVAFGDGFEAAEHLGSENNDAFSYNSTNEIVTATNHCGGILGGITNGMPLVFHTAIKPTPSISKEQQTVNLEEGKNTTLEIKGRHDPCILPRAVPVVESAAAIAVLDMWMIAKGDKL